MSTRSAYFGGTKNQSKASTATAVVASEDASGSQMAASADARTSVIATWASPTRRSRSIISTHAAAHTTEAPAQRHLSRRVGTTGISSVIGATVPDIPAGSQGREAAL